MNLIIRNSHLISRYNPTFYSLHPVLSKIKEIFLDILNKSAFEFVKRNYAFSLFTTVFLGMYVYWRKNDIHHLSSFFEFYKEFVIAQVKQTSSQRVKMDISAETVYKKMSLLSRNKKAIIRRALTREFGSKWKSKLLSPSTPRFLLNYKSCGANARAVHHLYAEIFATAQVKRFPLNKNGNLLKKIRNRERGIFEIRLYNQHLVNQKILGHAFIIEKVAQNAFRIYQSFVGQYTLKDYLDVSKGKVYTQQQIIRYFDKVTLLCNKGAWNRQSTTTFKETFLVHPKCVGPKQPEDQWRRYVTFYRYQLPRGTSV